MTLLNRIRRKIRISIAGRFPGRFPAWYSTLDDPVEVPVQKEAYHLAKAHCILSEDRVLDVGFGLGYGLKTLSGEGVKLHGIDIDTRAVNQGRKLTGSVPGFVEVATYDGINIPYPDHFFEVVTCIDVIEHVHDYLSLIREMLRVSRRKVFISTPIRRPEFTRPDGKPKNRWHLREWSLQEFANVLGRFENVRIEWKFINGPYRGPFHISSEPAGDTLALAPTVSALPENESGTATGQMHGS